MRCRIVSLREVDGHDEHAWRQLATCAAEPNPLMEPDCLLPAARHQAFGGELEIAFAEEGDRFYACMPLRSVRRHGHSPYPFVTTQVRRTIECGTPLVDAERGAEGLATIFSALSKRRSIAGSRVLVVLKISCDGAVFDAFQVATRTVGLPYVVYESWERGALKRRHDGDYERSFTRNLRKSLRQMRRRFREEFGTEPRLVDQTSDPGAVDRYLCLENSGYKGATGVAMATAPGESEFFRDLCQRFAAAGRLRILALMADEQTIAMEIWLRGGDTQFRFKMSYDERYAGCAPGLQMQVAAIHYFHDATDADWIDTCTGRDNQMALRLYPDRRRAAFVFVPLTKNPVDRLAVRAILVARPVHRWIYSQLHSTPRGTGAMSEKSNTGARRRVPWLFFSASKRTPRTDPEDKDKSDKHVAAI
jgi:CelD/BcsL family acetyltransferase involved in cellulose biosynthesis